MTQFLREDRPPPPLGATLGVLTIYGLAAVVGGLVANGVISPLGFIAMMVAVAFAGWAIIAKLTPPSREPAALARPRGGGTPSKKGRPAVGKPPKPSGATTGDAPAPMYDRTRLEQAVVHLIYLGVVIGAVAGSIALVRGFLSLPRGEAEMGRALALLVGALALAGVATGGLALLAASRRHVLDAEGVHRIYDWPRRGPILLARYDEIALVRRRVADRGRLYIELRRSDGARFVIAPPDPRRVDPLWKALRERCP